MTDVPKNEQDAVDRGMSALETLAVTWAVETDMRSLINRALGHFGSENLYRKVLELVKQGYMEGAYAGRCSAQDEVAALQAANAAITSERNDLKLALTTHLTKQVEALDAEIKAHYQNR